MIKSMTGFANISQDTQTHRLNLELRAVNHRYLDVQFKMPDEYRFLEGAMREIIAANVTRGKVECRLNHQLLPQVNETLSVNDALVTQLAQFNANALADHPQLQALSVADILRHPGVLISQESDKEALQATILTMLKNTVADFNRSREREGEKMAEHLTERLSGMLSIVEQVKINLPVLIAAHIDKCETRLREALTQIDDDRLKQEFAMFMQKADVDEELSRLDTHIAEVKRIISSKGSVGKRLDFLMQELNREANTLGSKAIAAECTQASVNLKVLIEQMREQVQNIE